MFKDDRIPEQMFVVLNAVCIIRGKGEIFTLIFEEINTGVTVIAQNVRSGSAVKRTRSSKSPRVKSSSVFRTTRICVVVLSRYVSLYR